MITVTFKRLLNLQCQSDFQYSTYNSGNFKLILVRCWEWNWILSCSVVKQLAVNWLIIGFTRCLTKFNLDLLICNFVYKQELGTPLSSSEYGFPLSYYSLSSTKFDVMQFLLSRVNSDFYLIFPGWNGCCKKSWSVIQKGHVSFLTFAGDFSEESHCLLCNFGKVIGKTIV